MNDHLKSADVLGYLDIWLFGYPDIRIRIFRIFVPQSHILRAGTVKLGMNDHLMGANVLGYPDIRISAFEIFGFFRILGLCGINFEAIMFKLGVDDNHMGPDV